MAATLAKFFIIMTLAFEVITIATGVAFYTAFVIASAVILGALLLKMAVEKTNAGRKLGAKTKNAVAHV